MATKGVIIRDVTKKECPWLDKDLKKGHTVFEYGGCTYGCIGRTGVAVSDKPGQNPFYEVPIDAVKWG